MRANCRHFVRSNKVGGSSSTYRESEHTACNLCQDCGDAYLAIHAASVRGLDGFRNVFRIGSILVVVSLESFPTVENAAKDRHSRSRIFGERPYFEKAEAPAHPDDPYTLASVRDTLTRLHPEPSWSFPTLDAFVLLHVT